MAIQMNVSGLRRNIKNIAHNYTDAQVKVREATSNDPWGPSSTLMSEIADLTYNVVAFSEIMQMVWKRLNDHGRNWRHVYKALVLLEYLIKTGSEKVADQCKENIYTIQTLKDFQYLEENKDMGINVREKAKTLVSLLKDDERLRNERVRALKSKELIAQTASAIGSDSDINSPTSPSYPDTYVASSTRADIPPSYAVSGLTRRSSSSELESARPQTVGEEELQLQLALAMSKEEADQEEAKKKSDDVRLQMALSQSETDYSPQRGSRSLMEPRDQTQDKEKSALNDLLDINFNPNGQATAAAITELNSHNDPWGIPISSAISSGSMSPQNLVQPPKSDPWGITPPTRDLSTPKQMDPWGSSSSAPSSRVTSPPTTNDPWAPPPPPPKSPELPKADDPWCPVPAKSDPWTAVSSTTPVPAADPFSPICNIDEFSVISQRDHIQNDTMFDLNNLSQGLPSENGLSMQPERPKSKSPITFLGENSNLVNLDNLVSARPVPAGLGVNPFNGPSPPNPFQAQQAPKPSMNQMRDRTTASPSNSPWGTNDPGMTAIHNNDDPFDL